MRQETINKINGYGVLFRFILPAIVIIVGTILSGKLTDLKSSIDNLDTHFTNHLSDHKSIEIMLERRLTCIETEIRNFKR